jgi:hypothetical protein
MVTLFTKTTWRQAVLALGQDLIVGVADPVGHPR